MSVFDPRSWFDSLSSETQAAIVADAKANDVDNVESDSDTPEVWDGVWPAK